MDKLDIEHLGDGVYAGHDSFRVWLTTGNHRNPELVYLEPGVLLALVDYAKSVGILQGE